MEINSCRDGDKEHPSLWLIFAASVSAIEDSRPSWLLSTASVTSSPSAQPRPPTLEMIKKHFTSHLQPHGVPTLRLLFPSNEPAYCCPKSYMYELRSGTSNTSAMYRCNIFIHPPCTKALLTFCGHASVNFL